MERSPERSDICSMIVLTTIILPHSPNRQHESSSSQLIMDSNTIVAAHTHPWHSSPSLLDVDNVNNHFGSGQEMMVVGPTAVTVILQTPDGPVKRTITGTPQPGYPPRGN